MSTIAPSARTSSRRRGEMRGDALRLGTSTAPRQADGVNRDAAPDDDVRRDDEADVLDHVLSLVVTRVVDSLLAGEPLVARPSIPRALLISSTCSCRDRSSAMRSASS